MHRAAVLLAYIIIGLLKYAESILVDVQKIDFEFVVEMSVLGYPELKIMVFRIYLYVCLCFAYILSIPRSCVQTTIL